MVFALRGVHPGGSEPGIQYRNWLQISLTTSRRYKRPSGALLLRERKSPFNIGKSLAPKIEGDGVANYSLERVNSLYYGRNMINFSLEFEYQVDSLRTPLMVPKEGTAPRFGMFFAL
jgi:hypothetical protein